MTVESLLDNFDAAKIASLSDEELKEYLKDIVNLEPKPLPTPLVLVKEEEEETEAVDIKPSDIECPIKPSKKKGKKLTTAEKMALLEKEIEEL